MCIQPIILVLPFGEVRGFRKFSENLKARNFERMTSTKMVVSDNGPLKELKEKIYCTQQDEECGDNGSPRVASVKRWMGASQCLQLCPIIPFSYSKYTVLVFSITVSRSRMPNHGTMLLKS